MKTRDNHLGDTLALHEKTIQIPKEEYEQFMRLRMENQFKDLYKEQNQKPFSSWGLFEWAMIALFAMSCFGIGWLLCAIQHIVL